MFLQRYLFLRKQDVISVKDEVPYFMGPHQDLNISDWSSTIYKIGEKKYLDRVPDKVHTFMSIMPISSSNPMFDHLLESSHGDDSYMW